MIHERHGEPMELFLMSSKGKVVQRFETTHQKLE